MISNNPYRSLLEVIHPVTISIMIRIIVLKGKLTLYYMSNDFIKEKSFVYIRQNYKLTLIYFVIKTDNFTTSKIIHTDVTHSSDLMRLFCTKPHSLMK